MLATYDVNMSFPTADANGIAESQTPTVGGSLTLDGVLVSGGIANLFSTFYPSGAPLERQVVIACAANETARTFTVEGGDGFGRSRSITLNGGDSVAVGTALGFAYVTDVMVDAGTAGAVEVGTGAVGWTAWLPLDWLSETTHSFQVDATGTINYDVEYTLDDPFEADPSDVLLAFDHDSVVGAGAVANKTADAFGTLTAPVKAIRLKRNSGTGSARLKVQRAVVGAG